MATFRKNAVSEIISRKNEGIECKNINSLEIFACNVFSKKQMHKFIPAQVMVEIEECVLSGKFIERHVADVVAAGMKSWASGLGATHYTHWFQPLTGGTAEKHDTFFGFDDKGEPIEILSGHSLAQQETDASSFPNGGIRDTFEARGYSAWDPSSPAFVIGQTLCIPTIFISYTGEALDFKAPLIKALYALDQAATKVCQYVDKNINHVYATLGWEQEYFLVDEALYATRPDLIMAGRTLFGHEAAKGQQLEDHYFGSIPDRILNFMAEYENEAWKLGIPVSTRHNEVAPSQFELAAVYEEANLSNDHNQLMMYLLGKIARKHRFRVLLHEKPYGGVNGSGKHNNWSLATNTGRNLLSPGKNPKSNLLFLAFFINTLKAVDTHADLLRASIASAGNDFRLGANEAPPAIMSVFVGSYLQGMLEEFSKKVSKDKFTAQQKTELKLNIIKIPPILIDNTDRNRTSPFAFTGNKFEFRAVGSSDNCAAAMIALNTAIADQLNQFRLNVDNLVDNGFEKDEAMYIVLREIYLTTRKRIFNGNGYSSEWVAEAKKRGLSNVTNTPEALKSYISRETTSMFEKNNVLSKKELQARYEIKLEKYYKNVQIESRVMSDLVKNHIIPVSLKYQGILIENVKGLKDLFNKTEFEKLSESQISMISEISLRVSELLRLSDEMNEARKKANQIEHIEKRAKAYREKVFPFFETIRYHADKLELIVGDEEWPLPKYRELLFMR